MELPFLIFKLASFETIENFIWPAFSFSFSIKVKLALLIDIVNIVRAIFVFFKLEDLIFIQCEASLDSIFITNLKFFQSDFVFNGEHNIIIFFILRDPVLFFQIFVNFLIFFICYVDFFFIFCLLCI